MEVFLEKIVQSLLVLGIDVRPCIRDPNGYRTQGGTICDIKGVKARGYRIPDGFLVLKGSEAVCTERPSSEK